MLSIYDLYDLRAVFLFIREFPDYKLNIEILTKSIDVLLNKNNQHEQNLFRIALSSIPNIDKEKFYFAFTQNVYVYMPSFLKDELIYNVLIKSCECLLETAKEQNKDKLVDLADCLHNLPIIIVENKLTIPKSFWSIVKYYRKK